MTTIKEATLEAIKNMSDESTADEIMHEIHFISQVFKGLEDAKEGNTLSTDELLQRVKKWAK